MKQHFLSEYLFYFDRLSKLTGIVNHRFCTLTFLVPKTNKIVADFPKIKLTDIGEFAKQELLNIERHYDNIKIDKFVIMPNHIHLIIQITERINPFPTINFNISNVVGKFKAAVTRNVGNAFMHSEKNQIWQRSFHDHIIRGENDYLKIWNYIDTNPQKWKEDCFYTE